MSTAASFCPVLPGFLREEAEELADAEGYWVKFDPILYARPEVFGIVAVMSGLSLVACRRQARARARPLAEMAAHGEQRTLPESVHCTMTVDVADAVIQAIRDVVRAGKAGASVTAAAAI